MMTSSVRTMYEGFLKQRLPHDAIMIHTLITLSGFLSLFYVLFISYGVTKSGFLKAKPKTSTFILKWLMSLMSSFIYFLHKNG